MNRKILLACFVFTLVVFPKGINAQSDLVTGGAEFLAKRFNSEIGQFTVDFLVESVCDEDSTKFVFETVCETRESFNQGSLTTFSPLRDALKEDREALPFKLIEVHISGPAHKKITCLSP